MLRPLHPSEGPGTHSTCVNSANNNKQYFQLHNTSVDEEKARIMTLRKGVGASSLIWLFAKR